MKYEVSPFGAKRSLDTLNVELGKESIRLAITEFTYAEGQVELEFHALGMFPWDVRGRYRSLNDALVLVVNDVDQHDGFAIRTDQPFIRYVEDRTSNMSSPPALPLPPRGSLEGNGFQGGKVSGRVSFQVVPPIHRPSVFLYMVLENYVSNVIGLDLVDRRAIEL